MILETSRKVAMIYKFSKFNTYVKNTNEELLMYNSLAGKRSFCKTYSKDTKLYEHLIHEDDGILKSDVLKDETVEFLRNRRLIVEESTDEMKELSYMNLRVISSTAFGNVLSLIILPTGKCNFKCEYCYETFENGKMTKEIQDAIIKL